MSVRGEFVRLVGDAEAVLRGGSARADALADRLLRARAAAADDLSGAAAAVLALWEDASVDALALSEASRRELDHTAERMLAVSRVILGR